jgi:hypothetical protein
VNYYQLSSLFEIKGRELKYFGPVIKPSLSDPFAGLPLRLGRAALLQDPGRRRCPAGVRCAGMHGVGGAQTRLHHECGHVQLVPELHLPVRHHDSAPVCGAGLRSGGRVPGLETEPEPEPERRVSQRYCIPVDDVQEVCLL